MAIRNLTHPDNQRSELAACAVELLTVPADLAEYRSAVSEVLQRGTPRTTAIEAPASTNRDGEGRVVDGGEAAFTGLTYIGLAHLNVTRAEVELTAFGELLDSVHCWRIETERAEQRRVWCIGDVIPPGN